MPNKNQTVSQLSSRFAEIGSDRHEAHKKVLVTFDVEDMESPDSIRALLVILDLLQRNRLRALFFVTGEMASKLRSNESLMKMLAAHEIGYHSSLHSVRPTILECADVENYDDAVRACMAREMEPYGFIFLKEIFGQKEIIAFRAPRMSWSPAHLAALSNLGIRFDFSTNLCEAPVAHRGMTFFPRPLFIDKILNINVLARVMIQLLTHDTIVLGLHPSMLMYKGEWDWKFMPSNVALHHRQKPRSVLDIAIRLVAFRAFFLILSVLRDIGFVEITPKLASSVIALEPSMINFQAVYRATVSPSINFVGYEPRNLMRHLMIFLGVNSRTTTYFEIGMRSASSGAG
jgi:peptidoglycan/xylan/chitin deacetylase (PgdA/CDA1 family)